MGDKIRVLNTDGAMAWSSSDGVLGPVRLADEVMGAGHGYRVIQFMAPTPQGALGGALVNSRGQLLGIITGSQNTGDSNLLFPWRASRGCPAQGLRVALGTGKNLSPSAVASNAEPAPEEQPAPIDGSRESPHPAGDHENYVFQPLCPGKGTAEQYGISRSRTQCGEWLRGGELLVKVDRPLFTYDWTYTVTELPFRNGPGHRKGDCHRRLARGEGNLQKARAGNRKGAGSARGASKRAGSLQRSSVSNRRPEFPASGRGGFTPPSGEVNSPLQPQTVPRPFPEAKLLPYSAGVAHERRGWLPTPDRQAPSSLSKASAKTRYIVNMRMSSGGADSIMKISDKVPRCKRREV